MRECQENDFKKKKLEMHRCNLCKEWIQEALFFIIQGGSLKKNPKNLIVKKKKSTILFQK